MDFTDIEELQRIAETVALLLKIFGYGLVDVVTELDEQIEHPDRRRPAALQVKPDFGSSHVAHVQRASIGQGVVVAQVRCATT